MTTFTDDGEINFSEFVTMISKKLGSLDIQEEILEAFRVFDKDGNGAITKDELRNAMMTLGKHVDEKELDELVQLADVNQDGQINYSGGSFNSLPNNHFFGLN